jgi:hypothetical protein
MAWCLLTRNKMQLRNPQPNAYLLISGLFAELQGKTAQIG